MFSWTLTFITNEKGAESSKILNLFIHAPLFTRDDVLDISLDCALSQIPPGGTVVRLPRPLSLMFPYSRRVMIVLRWSLDGVVSEGHVLGLFIPFPPAVLIGFIQEANISLEAAVGQILFLSAVFVRFQSRYESTLIHVPPSIRPM